MFSKFILRENEIFEILRKFSNEQLEFVIVGGYGISAYKHRFSVDADIVIKSEDIEKFNKILLENQFKQIISKELNNIYSTKFIRYEKQIELPVYIDILIDGIGVRQTNAAFSFELLKKLSEKRKIEGIEKEVDCLVPKKEMLIALKLHSARLTDLRDIAALADKIDFSLLKKVINIGEKEKLREHIHKLLDLIEKKEFVDSFKGVFMEKRFEVNIKEIKRFKMLINL